MIERMLGNATRQVVTGLLVLALGACGDDEGPGHEGATGGASATGGAGGVGGSGEADIEGRRCGPGEPCSAGGTCALSGFESGVRCECDPSGHFFCEAWAAGSALPPFDSCTADAACSGGSGGGGGTCSETNGYCTRTCSCESGCSYDACDAEPTEPGEPGITCDASFCEAGYRGGRGSCEVKDGACDYKVDCGEPGAPPRAITGACPDGT